MAIFMANVRLYLESQIFLGGTGFGLAGGKGHGGSVLFLILLFKPDDCCLALLVGCNAHAAPLSYTVSEFGKLSKFCISLVGWVEA
jgi:hypothetical protein